MNKATTYGEFWHNEYLKVKAENKRLRELVNYHEFMSRTVEVGPKWRTVDNPYPKSKPVPPLTQAEIAAMDMAMRADDSLTGYQQGTQQ